MIRRAANPQSAFLPVADWLVVEVTSSEWSYTLGRVVLGLATIFRGFTILVYI